MISTEKAEVKVENELVSSYNSTDKGHATDMSELEGNDVALAAKLRLLNDAIDEIGFTPYHLKLFFLNGMGYATDSLLTNIESGVRTYVNYQFARNFPLSGECLQVGLLVGAVAWGFGADIIGRKTAFNTSLLLSAVFTILIGAMGNYGSYCIFVLLAAAAAGGNLVLDTCVFLEFLPHKWQFLLTFFALFWGVGQTVGAIIVYWGLVNYSCASADNCPSSENQGWRYIYYLSGAIVLVMAMSRIFVIRLQETPKFLVSNNRDEEAVESLQYIARKYNRPCSLTLELLQACGEITSNHEYKKDSGLGQMGKIVKEHLSVLFLSRKNARSFILLASSWAFLGIAYPLYSTFLPTYLASRGPQISASTVQGIYRDNIISNFASIWGPVIGGALLYFVPALGRRGVMAIGGMTTMAFLFSYTAVKTHSQNLAISSMVYLSLYLYYGCLYAYTPEVMPSQARATGNAVCIGLTRLTSLAVPFIGFYANVHSTIPVWICGAFVGILGLISLLFPYEPTKQRVV